MAIFKPPVNPGALGGLQGVLANLPNDLQQLNAAFAQQAPQPGAMPQGPGFLSTLLTSVGAGLSGQPGAAAGLVGQQQEALRQAERQNQEALHNFRLQQFDLALESVREGRRRSEATDDKQTAARQQKFENELAENKFGLEEFRAETDRMRVEGALAEDQSDLLNRELSFLLGDTLNMADQLDQVLADPNQTAFQIVLPATDNRPATPINTIADLRQAYRTIKEDILGGIEDQKASATIEKRFDATFNMVETRLREFERRQGIAARRPRVEERVAASKTKIGASRKPAIGGRALAPTASRPTRRQ